MSKNLRTWEGK